MSRVQLFFTGIIRRKKETVIFLLLTMTVFTLLCASCLCLNASNSAIRILKSETASTITIKSSMGDYEYPKEGSFYSTHVREINAVVDELKRLDNDSRVKYVHYELVKNVVEGTGLYGVGGATGISLDDEVLIYNIEEHDYSADYPEFRSEGDMSNDNWALTFRQGILRGINNNQIKEVTEKKAYLSKGRLFTDEELEKGLNVTVINENTRMLNGSNEIVRPDVGDEITVLSYVLEGNEKKHVEEYSLKVVGILSGSFSDSYCFYVPAGVVEKIQEDDEYYSNLYDCYVLGKQWSESREEYSSSRTGTLTRFYAHDKKLFLGTPVIKVSDPENVNDILNELKKALPYDDISIMVSSEEYDRISGSIGALEKTSLLLVQIVSVISTVIMSLVIMLSIRNRKQEIGIFLTLGQKKTAIMGRTLLEYLFLGTLSLLLSIQAGKYGAQRITENALAEYRSSHAQEIKENDSKVMEVMENFRIDYTMENIIAVSAISYGIIIISSLSSSLIILKADPKAILLRE